MAEALDLLRKTQARNAARHIGLHIEQPRLTLSQLKGAFTEADILALAEDALLWQPLQDANGNFYEMPDYDAPESGVLA